jgi:hypothetical protein
LVDSVALATYAVVIVTVTTSLDSFRDDSWYPGGPIAVMAAPAAVAVVAAIPRPPGRRELRFGVALVTAVAVLAFWLMLSGGG